VKQIKVPKPQALPAVYAGRICILLSNKSIKQVLTKEQAMKFLNDNKEILKNMGEYREISSMLN
jgi:hypothetical protein